MRDTDRIAIENAAHVLRAIERYAETHPDFAESLRFIPVPGGCPLHEFVNAISAAASRYPTKWVQERRQEAEDAA